MSIDSNISQLFSLANSALSSARSQASRIGSSSPTINIASLDYSVSQPASTRPTALSDLLTGDTTPATKAALDSMTEQWMLKYFPRSQEIIGSIPDDWAVNILTGASPFGLSSSAFEAVWHEGRDREYRSRASSNEQLRASFSMRGFSMPPGAFFDAMRRSEELSADAIAAVNRTQMIRDSEIKQDLVKFAAEQAVNIRFGILQELANFYQQWIAIQDKDIQAGQLKVQAYASLNSALAAYQNVELGWENLRLKAAEIRVNGSVAAGQIRASLATNDTKNGGLGAATRAFGDAAASAANAAGTLQADIATGARS